MSTSDTIDTRDSTFSKCFSQYAHCLTPTKGHGFRDQVDASSTKITFIFSYFAHCLLYCIPVFSLYFMITDIVMQDRMWRQSIRVGMSVLLDSSRDMVSDLCSLVSGPGFVDDSVFASFDSFLDSLSW